MITYDTVMGGRKSYYKVKLDGKHVGNIVKVEGGWQYKVVGSKWAFGAILPTVLDVQMSLEKDADEEA